MKGLPAGVQYSKRFLTNVIVDFGLSGSICHVGSLLNDKKPGEAQRFREKLAALGISPFVGVDLFPGQNVDIVADLCDPRFLDAHPRLERAFDLLYCSALLEHVPDPFACARTVRRMIKSGGHLYFAGPWVQGYHGYPDDYWRISFSGMRVLFPDIEWRVKWYQGNVSGSEKFTIDFEDPGAERKLFRMSANDLRVPISTRGMANLIIGGLGRARD